MEMDRIEENKELLWQCLEYIPAPYNRIRRDRPSTLHGITGKSLTRLRVFDLRFLLCEYFRPGIRPHGVINTYGMSQSAFMWNIRSNRQIKRIYEQLWNRSDLLVSFEGSISSTSSKV